MKRKELDLRDGHNGDIARLRERIESLEKKMKALRKKNPHGDVESNEVSSK